jgi:hypothetical protein
VRNVVQRRICQVGRSVRIEGCITSCHASANAGALIVVSEDENAGSLAQSGQMFLVGEVSEAWRDIKMAWHGLSGCGRGKADVLAGGDLPGG